MPYKIFHGDCLELMKEIPDGSVDMILTDLPYNVTACKWDELPIDLDKLWEQFKRIIKPCSAIVLFASGKFTHKLIASNFDWYKYKWFWIKNRLTNFVHAKNAPLHQVEELCVFSDGVINHATCTAKRMKYNPQGVEECNIKRTGRLKCFGEVIGKRPSQVDYTVQKANNYPSDVLLFNAPHNVGKIHPTQKPTDLLEYLIKTYTNEGETVLDATMGSGSTGVAAINTGRKFIGIEKEQNFFEIAEKRITEAIAKKEQSLF